MHAAVVRSFDHPPRYEEFPAPRPAEGQVLVDVLAAGLHPRVRSGANGTHCASDGRLPLIPGVDGVARLPDGRRVYFVADGDAPGTMAEQALLDPRGAVALPDDADPVVIAAGMTTGDVLLGSAAPQGRLPAGTERADPRRDRQRGPDGRPDRPTPRRRRRCRHRT
jgi:NADPH:quinone reductase-like Zn-dependent oxidoreductase